MEIHVKGIGATILSVFVAFSLFFFTAKITMFVVESLGIKPEKEITIHLPKGTQLVNKGSNNWYVEESNLGHTPKTIEKEKITLTVVEH
jgi:hypothetical protein